MSARGACPPTSVPFTSQTFPSLAPNTCLPVQHHPFLPTEPRPSPHQRDVILTLSTLQPATHFARNETSPTPLSPSPPAHQRDAILSARDDEPVIIREGHPAHRRRVATVAPVPRQGLSHRPAVQPQTPRLLPR
jgi:hypothetical protein